MANGGGVGMSGHNFDAFVSSQRTFNDRDLAAKIQEKYWMARQKFLAKIERNEDSCIVLSDSKLDSKLEIYRSIDKSCARLTSILEDYQNCLYVFANEENSLGILLKECSKLDKSKAGKIQSLVGKSLAQSSHQRIKLYIPLLRMYQEMDTFHTRAVDDTAETVERLEERRSKYRASLLWMKDISERLDPDTYRQLDKFRRVQNQVRSSKKAFDCMQMDVVQKIDLLMASRCNLINQILAAYQATLLETFERNSNNFRSIEEIIKREDIYEYEFKALKQLNPLKIEDLETANPTMEAGLDLLQELDKDSNNNSDVVNKDQGESMDQFDTLIDVSLDGDGDVEKKEDLKEIEKKIKDPLEQLTDSQEQPEDVIDQLENLFGSSKSKEPEASKETKDNSINKSDNNTKGSKSNFNLDLLNMDCDEQIANLLGPSESVSKMVSSSDSSENLFDWAKELSNKFSCQTSTSAQDSLPTSTGDFDLMGGMEANSSQEEQKPKFCLDLLTNELDDIDNSSYFKSLQRLQL